MSCMTILFFLNLIIQRWAAHFTLGSFNNGSSPTEMLQQLEWETLVHRQLVMFFKIKHEVDPVPQPLIMTRPPRPRPGYPLHFFRAHNSTDLYKNSFFPLAIAQWNSLSNPVYPLHVRKAYLLSWETSHLSLSSTIHLYPVLNSLMWMFYLPTTYPFSYTMHWPLTNNTASA